MANPTFPFGLRPVRYMNGSPWNGAANPYYKNVALDAKFFLGDPIVIVGDSNDAEVSAVGAGTFASGMLSEIEIATLSGGSLCSGVVVGIFPVTNASLTYSTNKTEAIVMVADDPNIIFEIRDDGNTLLTADTIGLNAIIETGTGDTSTGWSAMTMDTNGTPPAATANLMLTIMNMSRHPDNELLKNAVWDVRINQHTLNPAIAGVA